MSVTQVYGQSLFEIKGATVIINLDYGDSIVKLQSRHLHVNLDNDNAEFLAKLKLSTFINTENENFDPVFSSDDDIVMKGKFNVDHIETSNHAPLRFEFSGILSKNTTSIPIAGSAELQHIGGGGTFSCMLGFSFILDEDTLVENDLARSNLREVKVQVLQTILNEDTQH